MTLFHFSDSDNLVFFYVSPKRFSNLEEFVSYCISFFFNQQLEFTTNSDFYFSHFSTLVCFKKLTKNGVPQSYKDWHDIKGKYNSIAEILKMWSELKIPIKKTYYDYQSIKTLNMNYQKVMEKLKVNGLEQKLVSSIELKW